MFSRLTLNCLMTSDSGMSKQRDFYANLPLNGATKTGVEMGINEEIVLPLRANQHGMAFLISATESLSVSLAIHPALGDPIAVMASQGRYHVLHRKRTPDERLNPEDKYFITIKNTSGLIAKVAALYT